MTNPFLPQKLPINIPSEQLVSLLTLVIKVRDTLHELKRKTGSIPTNISSIFSMAESVQSTRIEGTQATFDEVMEAEATRKTTIDIQEVLNYRNALTYGIHEIITLNNPISNRFIKELHKRVLKNARGANRSPGEFRKIQNWIGSDPKNIKTASYIPPIAAEVPDLMSNLELFINDDITYDPLIAAGIAHAQLETIHPFLDGNGRVGRLLIVLYLLKRNVCGENAIFVSEELEKNKYKYYSLLNELRSDNPKWYNWLEFFINSINNQAIKYINKADQIHELIDRCAYQDRKVWKSVVAQEIFFHFLKHPITSSKAVQTETKFASGTVNSWLKYFVERKIIYTDDKQRHKIYRFYDLLDIIRQ